MEVESNCAKFVKEIEENDEIGSESVWTKVAEDRYALSLIFANLSQGILK